MKKIISLFSLLLVLTTFLPRGALSQDEAISSKADRKASKFGQYEDYSKEEYSGWKRISLYIPARDGTNNKN